MSSSVKLFPDLHLAKLQKVHTRKDQTYRDWIEKYCQERHYSFQIQKCDDKLHWLPDPVLDQSAEHKKNSSLKGKETTDSDRPSLKENSEGTVAAASEPATSELEVQSQSGLFTAQSARMTVGCTECSKLRVVYSKRHLSERQKVTVVLAISEFSYSCGAPLIPSSFALSKSVMCRPGLIYASPVEVPYYSADIGGLDICSLCGATY